MFEFKTQLKVGAKGEDTFAAAWASLGRAPLVKLDGRQADFATAEGKLVEVKTETRSLSNTPNFFIERKVVNADGASKSGGPFRALQEGVQLFVVWFPSDNTWWEFADIAALCRAAQRVAKENVAKLHIVRNEGGRGNTYAGHGWALNREQLVKAVGPSVSKHQAKEEQKDAT